MISGIKYISVESVISTVKRRLRTFEDTGLLDDSFMIENINYALERLGYSLEEHKTLVLDILDSKVEVPSELVFIEEVYKCAPCNSSKTRTEKFYYGDPQEFVIRDYNNRICYNKCDIENCETQVTRTIYLEKEVCVDKFCDKKKLQYKNNIPADKIHKDFRGLYCESDDFYTIKGNEIFFNFEEGHVLLLFTARKRDNEGYPLVEDNSVLIKALEDYIIVKELETIYYNGEADVLQRLQLSRVESAKSWDEALVLKKIPSHRRMMEYGKAKAKSINKLNIK